MYAVIKTKRYPDIDKTDTFYFVKGPFPHWTTEGAGIPRRALFELRGEARDVQKQVGGRIVKVQPHVS